MVAVQKYFFIWFVLGANISQFLKALWSDSNVSFPRLLWKHSQPSREINC